MPDTKEKLQWHPAFYAGFQIELESEAEQLLFENEHQLGTKPKAIDILVIKKQDNYQVQKNIGRIFKKHNIIEYKSPTDSLSIDDFYRVCGYTCFYKSDTSLENSILISDLTITFVCSRYPAKLVKHLKEFLNCDVSNIETGIYYVVNNILPIQFIITSRLTQKENLWLKSLTNHLEHAKEADYLVSEYRKHKNNTLYQSVMDIIVRANIEKFREVKEMCEALKELMKDEYDAMYQYFEAKNQEIENRNREVENKYREVENRNQEVESRNREVENKYQEVENRNQEIEIQKLEIQRQKQKIESQKGEILRRGVTEGQERTLISLILRKLKKHKPLETIASELEEEPDTIKKIYDMAAAHPEDNAEKIYQYLHAAV